MQRAAPLPLFGLLAPSLLLAAACGTTTSFVKAPEGTLGRVVVYRNGIAYYERRARVVADRLTLRVPADKVDDFLKSLTVNDAITGQALPLSFPTPTASSEGEVEMAIAVPGGTGREVALTYVTEAPAWKPSYRVMMGPGGTIDLEGWAIVDNTSGEDWRAVKVGVGSSSALSFRFDLRSIRTVQRETLHSQDRFAKAPPRGGSLVTERPREALVLDQLADRDIPRQAGHPEHVAATATDRYLSGNTTGAASGGFGGGRSSSSAQHRFQPGQRPSRTRPASRRPAEEPTQQASPTADDSRVRALAQALKGRRGTILLEGYASTSEREPAARALDRANILRNQLIVNGVPPAQIRVAARGAVPGQSAGVRVVEQPALPADETKHARRKEEAGAPVGESHFESKKPMTVRRGTSAMVSIVQRQASGEAVYLYDPESPAGSARYAFKAVRFRNPTGSTLESGPVTVYGQSRFVGEGITEAIPPHAVAVVPFALDRQVVIDSSGSSGDRIHRLLKIHRGVLTAEVQHRRLTKVKITNRLNEPATVLVRHTVPKGWQLLRGPQTSDRLGAAHLFATRLGAGATTVLQIEEATPMVRVLDLRSPVGLDLVRVYLSTPRVDPAFASTMAQLLRLHAAMTGHAEAIEGLRQKGDEYRQRNDELHAQIVTLKAVKARGTLMQHLEAKMREISQRLQENTIAIVDRQEKEMVAKVRFQEGLAELTLESKTPSTAAASASASPPVARP